MISGAAVDRQDDISPPQTMSPGWAIALDLGDERAVSPRSAGCAIDIAKNGTPELRSTLAPACRDGLGVPVACRQVR